MWMPAPMSTPPSLNQVAWAVTASRWPVVGLDPDPLDGAQQGQPKDEAEGADPDLVALARQLLAEGQDEDGRDGRQQRDEPGVLQHGWSP